MTLLPDKHKSTANACERRSFLILEMGDIFIVEVGDPLIVDNCFSLGIEIFSSLGGDFYILANAGLRRTSLGL
jgi:hypothetical protein